MTLSLRVTISMDGIVLTKGGRPAKRAIPFSKVLQARELEVTILPLLIGGQGSKTLTGEPGSFLPGDIRWKLLSMKKSSDKILVRYRRI